MTSLEVSKRPQAPKISISKLKKSVLENFPKDWIIREVLLSENDELDVPTFLARLPIYLKLTQLKRDIIND